jgi:hypothetical protein
MSATILACAVLTIGAAPVPKQPALAPAPRPAPPDASLILVGYGPDVPGRPATMTVLRIGVRNGKVRPTEQVWEGPSRFLNYGGGHRIIGNRTFVTCYGGALDLIDKKVVCPEMQGHLLAVDGPDVVYRLVGTNRNDGIYAFDILKGEDRFHGKIGVGKYGRPGLASLDGTKSIDVVGDVLTLHRDGQPPKSLGDTFTAQGGPLGQLFKAAPVLWLDDARVLTQTKNGDLVAVALDGKAKPVVTIKVEESPARLPTLTRDRGGRIVYTCGDPGYVIDTKAGTATELRWADLGHGFEASWKADEEGFHVVRHKGREIGKWKGYPVGRTPTWPHDPIRVATTADHIAIVTAADGSGEPDGDSVRVWSAATGEWTGLKLWPNALVGWVK